VIEHRIENKKGSTTLIGTEAKGELRRNNACEPDLYLNDSGQWVLEVNVDAEIWDDLPADKQVIIIVNGHKIKGPEYGTSYRLGKPRFFELDEREWRMMGKTVLVRSDDNA